MSGKDFLDHLPNSCPPADAKPYAGKMYRGMDHRDNSVKGSMDLDERHFKSYVELGKSYPIGKDCEAAGLSVWLSIDGVRFARRNQAFTRKWSIAAVDIVSDDGVCKSKGNENPSNFTYWPYKGRMIFLRSKKIEGPGKR